jgi:conjugal transfer pilus assembly protein TraF
MRSGLHKACGHGWRFAASIALVAFGLAAWAGNAGAAAATLKTPFEREANPGEGPYWRHRERGWFWYEDPPSERKEAPGPKPKAIAPATPGKPAELVEFEALQKRVEELRNIAIISPTERHIRNYLAIQNFVIEKASTFADVAQRVIWATPELDPTVSGRPVNAKALEVFDRQQEQARTNTVAQLARTHALFFFFRSDCPYCHQFAPLLRAFEAKWGLKIVPVSVDGGGLPAFPHPRVDNGIARTLDVRQVPALFLAEPASGRITPVGYGVVSEAELLERIETVTRPDADRMVPSATRFVSGITR